MSYPIFEECLKVKCAPTAKTVLLILAYHHNRESGRCDPSIRVMMLETCLSERSVSRAVATLEEDRYITIIRRTGISNAYKLHPRQSVTPVRVSPPSESHPTPVTVAVGVPSESHPTPVTVAAKQERTGKRTGKEQEGASLVLFNDPGKPDPKAKAQGTLEQLRDYAVSIGLPASDGEAMHDHWTANGWKNGVNRVQDWQAGIRKWKSSGWLPSQKGTPGATKTSKPSLPPL